jgi:hypothetical protein
MRAQKRLGRFLVVKIIGFTLIGEAVALPIWTLLHAAVNPAGTPANVSVATPRNELDFAARDIVPITIYDGPLPVYASSSDSGSG